MGRTKIILGVNNFGATNPEVIKYLVNIDDSNKWTKGSAKKVRVKCPNCGFEKEMAINKLADNSRGFKCQICGDGQSYPNKFMYSFMNQLDLKFEVEKIFEWAKDKRYDLYIPSINMIIENQGCQHYVNTSRGKSLEEEIKNDEFKKKIAKENGITHYIQLNCMDAEKDYIKRSIENSILSNIFDLTVIDWDKCDRNGKSNKVKEACDLFNSGMSIEEICEKLNIFYSTVYRYLNHGNEFSWCNFNNKEKINKYYKSLNKRILCEELNLEFDSIKECTEYFLLNSEIKIIRSGISRNLRGEIKHYKGYHFKYIED